MTASEHPAKHELAAFGRGELPHTKRVAVAEHLAACETCCAFLNHRRADTVTDVDPGLLQHTNPAAGISDANFASPDSFFNPKIPLPLANHPRYRIIDQLGEGGMGVVYKAEHRMMDRVVALKVLAPHLTANPAAVDRFQQEVKAAGRLSHPNIVISHDAEEAGGLHFLVMEFVEGISLDRLVARRGPLAVTMACHFARQVALGLQHAADKGMVHRDIKPQNLLVTRKGQLKILDFGLARLARDIEANGEPGKPRAGATAPNLVMGTPDYLSPEQAKNSTTVDIRSDLYSLGCTLYFLLSGRTPYAHANTLIDKLLAHRDEEPEPLKNLRADVSESLAFVLGRMMAKRPQDRYSTPAEAAAALAPFAKGIDATPPPAGSLAPAPAAATFEIIEAVVVKPSRPDFQFVSESTEVDLPPEPKKPSRKKLQRMRAKRKKLIATSAAVVIGGLLIGAGVKQGRKWFADEPAKDTAKNAAPAPSPKSAPQPSAPPVSRPQPVVLFVLPRFGLWMDDYLPVRRRLEANGVKVVTAAGPGKRSMPAKESNLNEPVDTDELLFPEMDVTPYHAIVFVGRNPQEFTGDMGGGYAAGSLIRKMSSKNGILAAICEGQIVLAWHDALNGKSVAANAGARRVSQFESKPIKWANKDVLIDGNVVTASAPEHATAFADALLKALRDN